jgi:mRNA interferase MazF
MATAPINGKQAKVMADQIMASDKSRLKNQLGVLSKTDILAIERAILVHLGMPK